MQSATEQRNSWLDQSIFSRIPINWETILFTLILIVAILTRFYILGTRAMSHDETSHVYFSWLFSEGQGYAHDPITHGPFQFHIVALTYFLFGDSDLTARIPAALFSIATVLFTWNYRRYLGRAGALVAALLLLISPYILYYGRYVRNEAFVAFYAVVGFWLILRYLEVGKARYLYWFTAINVLHLCTKETAFIFFAQTLLFLALYLIYRITSKEWQNNQSRSGFLLALILALLAFTAGVIVLGLQPPAAETTVPGAEQVAAGIPVSVAYIAFALGISAIGVAVYFALSGYGLERIRQERSFDLAMLLGTLILPTLTPFLINLTNTHVPVSAAEVNALTTQDIIVMAAIIVPVFIISILLGLWWNRRKWLISAAIWYSIFTILYTTLFTNGAGFVTGLVGSLGYWLAQQEVNRGSQPWYYYALIQVPIYEYLPLIGSILALFFALFRKSTPSSSGSDDLSRASTLQDNDLSIRESPPTLALLGFWAVTSLFAYSIAGEKMPWLTVHITVAMILLAAWAIGYLIDTIHWSKLAQNNRWLSIPLLGVFFLSLSAMLGSLLGANPPFAGSSLDQLSATSTFLLALLGFIASIIALYYLLRSWSFSQVSRIFTLAFLGLLAVLTMRTAFTASFINYDLANEYLVYAHTTPGIKIALSQIEDISKRTTGSLDMVVAYDDDTTYPYWWYLRNYPNQRYFGANPTRDLRDAPAILVGDKNFAKIEPIVGQAYYPFEYIRIWWPNQDYYNLTWERIRNALTDPQMREAIFQIWLNRDFTKYAELTGQDLSQSKWSPRGLMRLYLRKDIAAQLWDYGIAPSAQEIIADPYEDKGKSLVADTTLGVSGNAEGQFMNPRDVAVAPDGSLYVADTNNHRIQHLTPTGEVLQTWGSFADVSKGEAPGGTFYEPWGIDVAPDGTVYVADTWNHRIQSFTPEGEFIKTWGFFGQAETPFALWGPRDIATDRRGNVYVTDTGNKRIVIYDANGNFLNQFGSVGYEPLQFDEPVGIDVDDAGLIYVADTWNQRVQVIEPGTAGEFSLVRSWEVVAWYGQSLDNKPYLAVDSQGNVYVSDPEGYRILKFNNQGEFLYYWGDFGTSTSSFNLPVGVAVDDEDAVWVADSGNHRLLRFLPGE
jgi:uncharacterized protein (TIGR03663 family)